MDKKVEYVLKVAKCYQDNADENMRRGAKVDEPESRRVILQIAYRQQATAKLLREIAHDLEYM